MRQFKKPDLNAPRFRPKVYNVLDSKLFKEFKDKYPKYKDIDYKTFKSIIIACNEVYREKVIEYRDGVELPESLGFMFIGSCNVKSEARPNVDFAKSRQYGVVVTHKNWQTDGYLGKIFYTNYSVKYKVLDRQIWKFTPCRLFSRTVKDEYPKDWNKYVKVDNNMRISKMYITRKMQHMEGEKNQDALSDYNEFDI